MNVESELKSVGDESFNKTKFDLVMNFETVFPFLLLVAEPQDVCQLLKSPVINTCWSGFENTFVKFFSENVRFGERYAENILNVIFVLISTHIASKSVAVGICLCCKELWISKDTPQYRVLDVLIEYIEKLIGIGMNEVSWICVSCKEIIFGLNFLISIASSL